MSLFYYIELNAQGKERLEFGFITERMMNDLPNC